MMIMMIVDHILIYIICHGGWSHGQQNFSLTETRERECENKVSFKLHMCNERDTSVLYCNTHTFTCQTLFHVLAGFPFLLKVMLQGRSKIRGCNYDS